MRRVPLVAVLCTACVASKVPVVAGPATAPTTGWTPGVGPIEHEAVVSGRFDVPLEGFVNMERPAAEGLDPNARVGMEWVVHVLRHPEHGTWIVDTGLPGSEDPVRGLVRGALKKLEVVETLQDILARQPAPLAGVLLTHMHIDHVLGLPDVAPGTPIVVGPDEQTPKTFQNLLLKGTFTRALEGHEALSVWTFGEARVGDLPAVDVFGDGSLIALYTPGHTPGSVSFLANTTTGPILLVGDTSHTIWGWENGVDPGTYTLDHEGNAASLASLKAIVATWPDIEVFVGHETDGVGTGIDDAW